MEKPFTELPLGTIEAQGWLREQLQLMADGMTGHLDTLYQKVVGPRNGWLGGDGDGWERGPYWIDGLLPLGYILQDEKLIAKAHQWVEWTLTNQTENGYLGPVPFETEPKRERGLQKTLRRDWWPKMVMLKVLQQYYMATKDDRVIDVLTKYFRYQLKELPKTPLDQWSWWAGRRGGDNLMVVYWLYNITGDAFLLELGELIYRQTYSFTDDFLERKKLMRHRHERGSTYHCVNLAQGLKTPIIYYQAHPEKKYLNAIQYALMDIERFHGQPHGLYGGDEALHGRDLGRGSELCTATEMMFSLEKMLEITGDVTFADRLEGVAYNVLPTQISDDFMTRQYFQQANQVMCTFGDRNFFNDGGDRVVYGLLSGYPCCTCNMHQGWPKFTQHLWMASNDNGLAALVFGPSRVTAQVAQGQTVAIHESTNYPFEETVSFSFSMERSVKFPLHLRIPGWCKNPSVVINGKAFAETPESGSMLKIDRRWEDADQVTLHLPQSIRTKRWHENSVSIYRGPLLYALQIKEEWSENGPVREVRPRSDWNYALLENRLNESDYFHVQVEDVSGYPWNLENAPISISTQAFKHPTWGIYNESAGPIPWSPQPAPRDAQQESVTLIPYGCSTLRISAFPTIKMN